MEDKFILMGLGDENAKEVADVLSNKTSKKILDFLGDRKEASEKDIADGLNMRLNTVEYNVKKLVKAGLVVKERHMWSVKGKKIPMYKLARKHIIISTGKKPSLSYLKTLLPVFVILGVLLIALAINYIPTQTGEVNITGSDEMKGFGSYSELKDFLEKRLSGEDYGYGIFEEFEKAQSAADGFVALPAGGEAARAEDYSTTNIQVEGVDEADIVKNDGKYIYVVSGNKVVIVDAFPAEDMKVLSEIEFDDEIYVRNIYINKDKMIVLGEKSKYFDTEVRCISGMEFGARCGGYSKQETLIYIYDVSDREKPEIDEKIEIDGYYVESRMINNYVYVVSSKYISFNNFELPTVMAGGVDKSVSAEDVYYFDSYSDSYSFNLISAIDIGDGDTETEVYLMDQAGRIYVSQDNIYLSYMKRLSQERQLEMYVNDVIKEVLPFDEVEKVEKIIESDDKTYEKRTEINNIVEEYAGGLDEEEIYEFTNDFEDALDSHLERIQEESEKTVVHKINVDGADIKYEAKGEVNGWVLNQFSMDEYDGYFRIATTNGGWGGGSENNVYVLNEDMEIVGEVEGLAEGETIYSARFMGERAYLVTFKKIDPLFVIDLSEPFSPEVLGYLKITGYSDYLHPYDENHIIGIGKETRGGNEDFSWYQGVKVSLFDVSDVSSPTEVAKIEIGDRGTDSYALQDYKAVLFDKEKNLLVLPISLAEIKENDKSNCWDEDACYGENVWQGAFVLDISLDGISEQGRITHYDKDDEFSRGYYGGAKAIQRSLYMDDVLYTISMSKVKANGLETLEEISEVKLGYEGEEPSYYVEASFVTPTASAVRLRSN